MKLSTDHNECMTWQSKKNNLIRLTSLTRFITCNYFWFKIVSHFSTLKLSLKHEIRSKNNASYKRDNLILTMQVSLSTNNAFKSVCENKLSEENHVKTSLCWCLTWLPISGYHGNTQIGYRDASVRCSSLPKIQF